MLVATYNVRTLAVIGRNGYGHAECVLAKARQLGCDFVGLQETRRAGKTEFSKACLLYTSPSPRDLSTSRMPSSA